MKNFELLTDEEFEKACRYMAAAGRLPKFCIRGHVRTPENTNNQGACKLCMKERAERKKAELKAIRREYDSASGLK